ncbi:MAG: type II secretion system F family protein [Candidatus Caenarcaniphilales bacterium]|nr:type II secretion system F family protein [Candidatus Caenarcaniphilales bacterium]
MDITLIIIIVGMVAIIGGGIWAYFHFTNVEHEVDTTSSEAISQRIGFLQENLPFQGGLEARPSSESNYSTIIKFFMELVGGFAPTPSPSKLTILNKAGLRDKDAHVAVFAQQIAYTTFGVIITMLSFLVAEPMVALILGSLLTFLFYYSVWSGVLRKAADRALKIDKTIPDMIDLFANCCLAGVSFDIAANFILNEIESNDTWLPVKEDFLAWQADVNFGIARQEAWKKLAERSDSKNMRFFTSLIDQSEQTGGSVSEALFKMSAFFRERRKQQIEAEIAALPGKMSGQTIVFIVFPIIVLLLLPIGISFFEQVKGVLG